VILHEIKASNNTFDVDKQRRNRAPIYIFGLRFYSKFETFCLVKNRAPMEPNWVTIWQTLQLGYEFNEAIVLRFTASDYDFSVSENFPIKGKLFSEGRVENFWRKKLTFRAGDLERRWRPSKLIPGYQFHVMNLSFILVICALAMSN